MNPEEEKSRLKLEIEDRKEYIKIIDHKLLNAEFIKNAPESVVRAEQAKKAQALEHLEKLKMKFNSL
ncbi:TPA: hypothetical protein DEG21_04675 [Patescibacteria group bacterium]|nr:hypothetical protein [Candidatus Gracilibacteria bacterium]HBY75128.1 hypothetical protein [Candidatus Gracilibacteria bacterium]